MTYCQQFSIADSHYKVSTNSPLIFEKIQYLLGGFASIPPVAPNPISFQIKEDAQGELSISPCTDTPQNYVSIDDFISQFELRLIQNAFDKMAFIGIHSGAIVYKNKTMLLPGRSGKGKTTLTLGCLLRGSSLLSDEMALIKPDTSDVYAFPRVLCNKTDLALFDPIDHQNLLRQPNTTKTFNNSLCLSPQSFTCVPQSQPQTIDAIIFPNYHAQKPTTLSPIRPLTSLQKIMKLTYKRQETPKLLDTLGQIVESVPSFELTMRNLPEAIERVEDFAK